MKNSVLLIISLLILSLTLPSCEKEDNVLPAITMEGKNTFGCLVNGEVWLPEGIGGGSLPIFVDMSLDNFLSIGADNDNSGIRLVLNDTSNIKTNTLYFLTNYPNDYSKYYIINDKSTCDYSSQDVISGKMMITKLENNIISGTFEFTTYNPECGDTIKVTEGRFDIGTITR